MSGIRGTEILRELFPDVPILALTVYDNDDQVFAALCAGRQRLPAEEHGTGASTGIDS
jgi:DNA-binding NarL/FixJ family response regulator